MAAGLAVVLGACNSSKKSDGVDTSAVNPFFTEYTTPFGVPPFEQIKVEHYKPAFLKGMEEQTAEVEAIVNNPDKATFENTRVSTQTTRFRLLNRNFHHCSPNIVTISA